MRLMLRGGCLHDWQTDCRHYWGEVLRGRFAHRCRDWDGLPLDENCREFAHCHCWDVGPLADKARQIRDDMPGMLDGEVIGFRGNVF